MTQVVQMGDKLLTGIQAFSAWKLSIANEIKRYRLWLHEQGLSSIDLDDRLARALRAFTSDRILLAFVGEFSRGKTELINAILGRHYKMRLFPTRIGRTTMCPTEVFYDPQASGPYIKLLPIQTRSSAVPLASYRRQLEHWAHLDLDLSSTQSIQRAFEEVAKTREVTTQVAESLGFEVEFLESSSKKAGYVHIPAWRHALINLDHPLLRMGLSIIDTPGLNALGLEPELTLSFLPEAHALLFVLSADCGVTASDFSIWNNHVRDLAARSNTALYAIINKIDLLDDDDALYPIDVQDSLSRLVRFSAHQLHLPIENVLPLSARQGARAYVYNDQSLLESSRLLDLEAALATSVITARQQSLKNVTLKEVIELVDTSQQTLVEKRAALQQEYDLFNRNEKDVEVELVGLTRLVRKEQEKHNQRLVLLQEGKAVLEQHLGRIAELVGNEKLEWHFSRARESASSTVGFGSAAAIGIFFQGLKLDLRRLRDEMDAAEQTANKIYQRYMQALGQVDLKYPYVDIEQYINEFTELEKQAAPYKNRFGSLLANQEKVFDHFFDTLAREAKVVYEKAREDAARWCKQVLVPLMQQTLEAKKRIDEQLKRLEHLQMIDATRDHRLVEIKQQLDELTQQEGFLQEVSFCLQPVELS
ncbi:dynamin family protein [Agitococcus lubricus]|uniref:Dynamin family protein n=1 Tax=Agitococcus lubricus TaxID=1077255 RepID=A0A2T5J3E8_9GAMM|nr:dynamin family protein [Agitococcus lubricus]PTQ91144.1 dynamin family protein [Agitococcus lubricus]